ncbi:hypothetical protein BRYFOR_08732 [Marvinbryantia formatexigens DSM 14469]|uniref:Signal peptidase II n=1 Tax=Marvinbryantia formatexigens DSM 14469 TaxID=478749 RepID=C6LJ97_9FIRM|nr:hypothetical protein BRYFOR_08732 [Marvinbryantia formatexigens DSM 14469]
MFFLHSSSNWQNLNPVIYKWPNVRKNLMDIGAFIILIIVSLLQEKWRK